MTNPARRASDIVRESIERDGVVRQGLARHLINVRALARSIESTARGEASFDAILGAIRRYPIRRSAARRENAGRAIVKISLKNRIAVLSVRNRPENQLTIARFAQELSHGPGETFRVISSPEAVSVTLDSRNLDRLESKIPRHDVHRHLVNLAEIVVETASGIEDVPGALSAITTELAVNDVSIVQLSTVGPGRIILLVGEKDVTRAYRSLEELGAASR